MSQSRAIHGRHLLLDGPGAIAEVDHDDAMRVIHRIKQGLAALGMGGSPVFRAHQKGASVGIEATHDLVEPAVDLLEWATSHDAVEELESVARRIERLRNPPLRALFNAFPGLVVEGEDLVTVGHGRHARSFRPFALPQPHELGQVRGIPIVTITGTNGKTTTTRLLARIAQCAGHTVGRTSSDGVVIGDDFVERGDWTGPGAARLVLRDSRVTFAALETARGGILRRGLVLDGADVAAITNVTPEHLGEWGIDDVLSMARAKLVLARGLKRGGTLIVPAVSAPLAAVLPEVLKDRPDIVVRTFHGSPLSGRRAPDGWSDGSFLHFGDSVVPVADIPITFGGTAKHNVENALVATLAALAVGLPGEAISRGLRTFRPSVDANPGRMNTFRLPNGALAVIDFAHNPDGVRRIAEAIRGWPRKYRTLLIGQAGDRRDEEIIDMARTALLLAPQRFVLKDVTDRLYGREPGEVPRLMWNTLRAAGVPAQRIDVTADETTGVRVALRGATHDDVVVLLIHETLNAAVEILREQGAVEVTG